MGHQRCTVMNQSILPMICEADQMNFRKNLVALHQQPNGTEATASLNIRFRLSCGGYRFFQLSVLRIQLADTGIFNIYFEKSASGNTKEVPCTSQLQALRNKEKELQKMSSSNQQLEAFAYVASHDLKEPLRSIGNFAQLLNKRMADKLDPTEKEFFGFITNGVKNMNTLIEDLLTYSRVNTSDHVIDTIQPMDSLAVVVNGLHQRIIETNATIEIKAIPKTIIANSTKIKQIFQNLIANAIKFQRPEVPPVVIIRGEEKSDTWEFSVEDNGIGIKKEYFDKVFGIFTKLHHKSVYPGSGIGLSVCQRIAQQHGGDIWLESEVDKGTTFWFSVEKK